jgi:hypothetical protein
VKGGKRWPWIALVAVAVVAVAVIFLLPALVAQRGVVPIAGDESAPGIGDAAKISDSDPRADAEEVLQRYLRTRARLEIARAGAWAEPQWSLAADEVAKGDRSFARRDFAEAGALYAGALQTLESLESEREPRLTAALAAGAAALADDDGESASAQFELALAIEPDHDGAVRGLARARVRAEVLVHMGEGERAETDGDLEAARVAYGKALALDGDYESARGKLELVSERIAEREFRRAMSRALEALEGGRLAEAGEALEAAASRRPDDPALRDARRQLAAARRQSRLSSLRREAGVQVRAERWQAAAATYEKALAVADDAGFAREGLSRARERALLHQRLDAYLADPTRLYAAETLADAERLLANVGTATAAEPRLAEKLSALNRHVAQASRPVSITLRSDGETEIVIYRVGRLGRFEERRVELLPGSYTAVGSRAGYRDVRQGFTVLPGAPPSPVVIRCEEPI